MDQLAWYGGLVCGSSQINLLTQPPQKKNVSESGQKWSKYNHRANFTIVQSWIIIHWVEIKGNLQFDDVALSRIYF